MAAAAARENWLTAVPFRTPAALAAIPKYRSDVRINATLSQEKFVRGADGEAYLRVSITTPKLGGDGLASPHAPCDYVVVLDHSNSMSQENRLPFAKAALL